MPSLRRTLSTSSVRSSPYPTSLGVAQGRGHGPRRSSDSETSSRRVLADIDWWRVIDGQRSPDADAGTQDDSGEREGAELQGPLVPARVLDDTLRGAVLPTGPAAQSSAERPSTPVASVVVARGHILSLASPQVPSLSSLSPRLLF